VNLAVRPNPAWDRADISYSVERPGYVSCVLYDAAGNRRAELVSSRKTAGAHRLVWHAAVPAGAYLCRLETPSGSRTVRLVKAQ